MLNKVVFDVYLLLIVIVFIEFNTHEINSTLSCVFLFQG